MEGFPGQLSNFHAVEAEFLLRELDLASTFLDVAGKIANSETLQRSQQNVLKAYYTVWQLLGLIHLTDSQRDAITKKLRALKQRLQQAGVL